jgi:predicted SnoaL-like aldol condensation-catalyzing enzyme
MKTTSFLGAVLCLALASCTQFGAAPRIDANRCDNRQTVLDFYQQSLIELHPRRAFERYASADFVEHKPDVPQGNREATATFLEALITSMPKPRWEIIRTIAEGDMVFLHARFSPADGAPHYAIADVFRLENCLIVEHWDVVAGPPDAQANPNTRF